MTDGILSIAISLVKLLSSDVPSSKCSLMTKRRDTDQISMVREFISVGDSRVQMTDGLRSTPKEERESLMKEANFMITVPPEAGLAMKSDLHLTWKS